MPGRWNGPQVRRHPTSISLKFQRSKVAGLSGTSSTRLILIGNTNDKSEQTMNAATATTSFEPDSGWMPSKGVVGMSCLIIAESAIFTIFVVAYLYYLGKDLSGPTPRQVLELPILNSICLLSSSATITLALRSLRNDDSKRFGLWWLVTIGLGAYFLLGTGWEWHHLIYNRGLTLQTNLFGTTFYSLVGLHASHVVVGLLALSIVMAFAVAGSVKKEDAERVHVLGLYWHFVDVVWIVVFTVIYIIGR
jgi:cytochrome c oxidase subunit 3/cytochrome o ubiquinol oxidase subunit 3